MLNQTLGLCTKREFAREERDAEIEKNETMMSPFSLTMLMVRIFCRNEKNNPTERWIQRSLLTVI